MDYQAEIEAGLVYDAEADVWKECVVTVDELRDKRNALLADSDFSQLADAPLTDAQKSEWAVYRQALRDLPASATYLRRLLNYLVYLNDVPDGEGETEFLNQGLRNQPKKGNLVIFPAFFTHIHRGNPVYTTDKYIATGWMLWDQKPIEAKD